MAGVLIILAVPALIYPAISPDSGDRADSPLSERTSVDLARPFADTPAANWPEGEAGIATPLPVAIGRYSADEVARAMTAVRRLIVTARLDRDVLETHDAEPVLALLAPHEADRARALIRPGNEAESWWISVKIAPGQQLLPVTPRVSGTMTPTVDGEGELVIETSYIVAYAFHTDDPKSLDGPMDIVSVVRWDVDYIWVQDPRYDAGSQGIYYGDIAAHSYAVNCWMSDQGYLAPNFTNPPVGSANPDPRTPEEYFDTNSPLPPDGDC